MRVLIDFQSLYQQEIMTESQEAMMIEKAMRSGEERLAGIITIQ
jgi:hypothetical protein